MSLWWPTNILAILAEGAYQAHKEDGLRMGIRRFYPLMKRIGQALKTRMPIDKLFDDDPSALIVVCGDFNEKLMRFRLKQ